MVNKLKIAIIVDNPKRDLAANVLLANELALRGFRVFLVPHYIQSRELVAIKPHITVLNYHRKGNDWLVEYIIKLQSKVFILETEGAVFVDFNKTKEIYSQNEDVKSKVEGYFIWGAKIYNEFIKNNIYPTSKLHLTGSPRTDLLAPMYRNAAKNILLNELNEIERRFFLKKFFLINTNNALINGKLSDITATRDHLKKTFGYEDSYIDELFDEQKERFYETIELSKRISNKYPNEFFVIRPHPFEKEGLYKEHLHQFKNILITNTGSIDGWLTNCKAVIMKNCSTALEAAISGVPSISIDWLGHKHNVEEIESISLSAKNTESLFTFIDEILDKKSNPIDSHQESVKKIISDLYYKNDGNNHKRIADIIESFLEKTDVEKEDKKVVIPAPNFFVKKNFNSVIKNILGINNYFSFRKMRVLNPNLPWIQSDFYFDEKNVNFVLTAIDSPLIAIQSKEQHDKHYVFSKSIEITK